MEKETESQEWDPGLLTPLQATPGHHCLPLRKARGGLREQGVCREWGLQEQLGPFHWEPRAAFQETRRKGGSCLRNQQALRGRHTEDPTLTEWQLLALGPQEMDHLG